MNYNMDQLFKEVYGPFLTQALTGSGTGLFIRMYYDRYSCLSCQEEFDVTFKCPCHMKDTKLGKVLYR